jgi:hypothetical protein
MSPVAGVDSTTIVIAIIQVDRDAANAVVRAVVEMFGHQDVRPGDRRRKHVSKDRHHQGANDRIVSAASLTSTRFSHFPTIHPA